LLFDLSTGCLGAAKIEDRRGSRDEGLAGTGHMRGAGHHGYIERRYER